MISCKRTNKKGFFRLPAELRNTIYEYVLTEVQDNMCIDLENGLNQKYRPRVRQQKRDASPLSMLLTCRKINREASPMAYSKMSMSLDAIHPDRDAVLSHWDIEAYLKNRRRLKSILATFANTFRADIRSYVTTMRLPNLLVLYEIVRCNCTALSSREFSKRCSAKCDLTGSHRGLVHNVFHHIRRIIVEDLSVNGYYRNLVEGASWLSIFMTVPAQVEEVFRTFSNLEEIVVRRGHAEQVSHVVDGKIYASGSGMLLGGTADWLPGYVKVWYP